MHAPEEKLHTHQEPTPPGDADRNNAGHRDVGRYDAFLSYAWEPDARLVTAVRDGLHRLARPWYRLRALRVFRDQSSLSANSGLAPAIENALADSRFLIVFLSPQAAASRWVAEEIGYWLTHKSVETLRLVWSGGTLVWDDAAGDFDLERSSALPSALLGVYENQPLHVDLRWAAEDDRHDLRDERFRGCLVQLAAPLHGRDTDDLHGEDVRQHRKTRRVAAAAVTALAVLAAATAVAAVLAVLRAEEALANLRQATSRYLAGQALADRDTNLDRALLLAVHAWRTAETAAARDSLVTTVHEAMRGVSAFPRIRAGAPIPFDLQVLAISPDGRRIAATRYSATGDAGAPADGRIYVWDVTGGQARIVRSPFEQAVNVRRLVFGPDGRHLAAEEADGQVMLWDLAADPARLVWTGDAPMDVTADHGLAAAASASGVVAFVDLRSGRVLDRRPGTLFEVDRRGGRVFGKDQAETPVVWDPRSSREVKLRVSTRYAFAHLRGRHVVMATGAKLDTLAGYDAAGGERRWRLKLPGTPVAVAVSPTGDRAAAWTSDGTLVIVATEDGRVIGRGRRVPGREPALAYSPSGGFLVAAGSGDKSRHQTLLDARTGRARWTKRGHGVVFGAGDGFAVVKGDPVLVVDLATGDVVASGPDSAASIVAGTADNEADSGANSAVSPDGGLVALPGDDVRLVDLNTAEPRMISLPGQPGPISAVSFDPSGRRLVGVGYGGAAVVWDVASALRPADVPAAPRAHVSTLSGDGVTLFHADASQALWRRDLRDGRGVPVPGLTGVSGLSVSPGGTHLLAYLGDEYVLWSLAAGAAVLRFPSEIGMAVAFSGDGRRLARTRSDASGRFTAIVHEVDTGGVVAGIPLPDFAQPVGLTSSLAYPRLALDHEGTRLAAGLSVTQIRVWDVGSGASGGGCDQQADTYTLSLEDLWFTPDGKALLLSDGDRTIRFADPASCAVLRSLRVGNGTGESTVTLNRDGTLMVTDDPLRLWDTRTFEPLGEPFPGDGFRFQQAVFTADGSSLMTRTFEGEIRRWPVGPAELIRRACAIAGRELTPAEQARFLPADDRRPACRRSDLPG
ncbi:PQQ-binding-like beta-propeller repeat protein [Nonomuraea sp. NN258]|uniref:toll/interleukin-1 receptor domain-containing protein n=1 Tax=Nonomuraea antri TaxID=2730852 RepID=UPI001569F409|nr:PQQ-binding-like beta-propeller repeat protein [Nonomuraea antri]NRQ32362.1 PQQ-binding-like beta-propeller repeat protein [Nonomuraea antri]